MEQPSLPDLAHHLSHEAQERLPNTMKTFLRSLENAPALSMISLANGDPHAALYAMSQVDFHVPAVSTLGSVSSWIDRSAPTQKLSAFNGSGKSTIDLSIAMQYGTGLGLITLREQLSTMNEFLHHPNQTTSNIILTLGNADAITKLYRLFGSPGDTFLVEEYSFCGLTNAPIAQGVRWQPVKVDEMGLIPSDMEATLSSWDEVVRGRRPHVLYCIPCMKLDSTGQNPTGATIPLERRRAIYALARKYDIIILEDDPYYFLQYDTGVSVTAEQSTVNAAGAATNFLKGLVPSFLSLDVDGRVVRVDSVSKIIAPNMRLGWITCNPLFSRKLEILTDNSTQHPHGLGQSFMAEILAPTGWGMDGYFRWVWGLRNEYQRRRNLFFEIFQREIGVHGFASTKLPIAGMFFWIRIHIENHPRFLLTDPLPQTGPKTNTKELLDEIFKSCYNSGLLVMPGGLFAMQPTDKSIADMISSEDHITDRPYFRTTFVGTDETIEKGLTVFGQVLKQFFID
ncbi:L-tyrosine:2-oxoglutarate aminotransferase [Ramaria rubella]|nr:L-tyrosine:2-oxoglutarate aminotransferase [Ramaria rubella]